jgi:Arc/MetJ family transcription regulator
MRTNIDIDETLVADVMNATGAKTKREAVDRALRQTLQLHRQSRIMELWGLGWEGDLDEMRTSKHLPEG